MSDTPTQTKQTTNAQDVIKDVASRQGKKKDEVVEMEQLVTFSLDQEEYAAVITDLREIIRIPEVVAIPGAPGYIRGILNLRGQLVVVVDLERRVGLVREHEIRPKHIIIVEIGDTIFGIIVDEVSGVLRVPVSSIRATPGLVASKIHTDFLKGVVILETDGEGENIKEQKKKKTKTRAPKKRKKKGQADKPTSEAEADEKVETDIHQSADTSRLILLVDLPKLLAEKELMEFGKAVVEAADNSGAT
jgi:purine-binding chemotaxis protein CheW